MMVSRRVLILALAVAAIVVTSVASAFALGILPPKAPGIYITITPVGLRGGIPRNAYVVVQVSMITPDGPMKTVYRGRLKGPTLFIPYSRVAGIVSKWVKVRNIMPSILIDYWVVGPDGNPIASGTTMVNYNPIKLANSKVLSKHAVIPVSKRSSKPPTTSSRAKIGTEDLRTFTWFEWRRVLYVAPENYTGGYYIKLPIVILYNSIYSTTNLRVEVDLGYLRRIRFAAAVAVGPDLENEVKTHGASYVIPKLNYRIFENATIATQVLGGQDMVVPSGKIGYVWVLARPVAEYQREWKCTAGAMGYTSCQLTGEERVIEYVSELKTDPSGQLYMGAVVDYPQEIAWPVRGFSEELEEFLSHVDLKKIVINGNMYLGDGKLDPGEYFLMSFIFPVVQYSADNEEMVLPVGAAMAAILLAVGGEEFMWLVPILGAFSLTMTYEANNILFFYGKIVNVGSSSVELYVGMTKLKYGVGSQNTYMPVLYFEAVPP